MSKFSVIAINRDGEEVLVGGTDISTERPADFIINAFLSHPATNINIVNQYYADLKNNQADLYTLDVLQIGLSSIFACNELISQLDNLKATEEIVEVKAPPKKRGRKPKEK